MAFASQHFQGSDVEAGISTAIHLPISKELLRANRLPGGTIPPHHLSAQELQKRLGGREEGGWAHTGWRYMWIFILTPSLQNREGKIKRREKTAKYIANPTTPISILKNK